MSTETPEEILRLGLYEVWTRYRSDQEMFPEAHNPLARSMARAAVTTLAETYPDDPLYRQLLTRVDNDRD